MEWILIALIYAGPMARGDSVALQTLPWWSSKEQCQAAGKAMEPLVRATAKDLRFVCIKK